MATKKEKAVKEIATKANIEDLLLEYDSLREREKAIKKRKETISDMLKDFAVREGVEDDKGSSYFDSTSYVLGRIAKKSISFDKSKSLLLFSSKGLDDCVTYEPSINEDAVEKHIASGDISYDELQSITKEKVTYSVSVVQKESMPEVKETFVASKKPKLSLKR